jgi:hypothetical protein
MRVKSRAEDVVGYLEDWEKLKEAYDDAASEARKEVWDAAKKAIKGKGESKAVSEFFESLKDLMDKEMLTGRKATGMTPVLTRYDKLFKKMDAMVKQRVSPTDKAWKPYVKEMNDCTADFRKAYAAVKTNFGKIVEFDEEERGHLKRNADLYPQIAVQSRALRGKSIAAGHVLNGAGSIKSSLEDRIRDMHINLNPGR